MIKKQSIVETTVVASDDGMRTFEIHRKWDGDKRTGVVIELYPTISAEKACEMDLTTMYLMNHVRNFGWGAVRIVNLYSTVFAEKPATGLLKQDMENAAYIEDILEGAEKADLDIVVAWGSSLSTHMNTVETKSDLLRMMKDKGLQSRVKCIAAGAGDEEAAQGTHPLFLGLHQWTLETFDIDKALSELDAYIEEKDKKKKERKKGRQSLGVSGSISEKVLEKAKKATKKKTKGEKADVHENQEQPGHDGTAKDAVAV